MREFPLGPDDVVLIVRDPVLDDDGAPTFDVVGHQVFTDRRLPKSEAKFTITGVTESDSLPVIATYAATCALDVDADSLALTRHDAIEHDGKVYELSGDALLKRTLIDAEPHHVRAMCARQEYAGDVELVTITPAGGQDFDGVRLPDGAPVQVPAMSVDPGNTAEKYGADGTGQEADFTVVLAQGLIRDGDWITVRGRRCSARVQRRFSQHADRNEDVVLARFRSGGG